MTAIWLKTEDKDPKTLDWTTFSLVNQETGCPTWEKKFFPNQMHYATYHREGIATPLLIVANFVDAKKTKYNTDNLELPKEIIRTRVYYNQPGFYTDDNEFLKDENYTAGKTFVETIIRADKKGHTMCDRARRTGICHYDATGSLEQFTFPLSPHLWGDLIDVETVDVKAKGDFEALTFRSQAMAAEKEETLLMRQWFAQNAKFANPKAFDFSFVKFDDFKPIEGKKDAYALHLK